MRLYGTATVCEGELTITVFEDHTFQGIGICSDETLGEFGLFNAEFNGSFSASGAASGEVLISSFMVSGIYELTGSIALGALELVWFVDTLSIHGSFTH